MEELIGVIDTINILLDNYIYNPTFEIFNIILLNFVFFLVIGIDVLGNLKVSSFFGVKVDS